MSAVGRASMGVCARSLLGAVAALCLNACGTNPIASPGGDATRLPTLGLTAAQRTPTPVSAPADVPAPVRALVVRLSSVDPVERARAAHDLGLLGAQAAWAEDALLNMLTDDVAVFALYGLAQTSPAEEAAKALASIGQPRGISRLVAELQGASRDRRALAVNALYSAEGAGLAEMRRAGAVPGLLAVAADASQGSRVRTNAVRLLGRLREREAVPVVSRLLKDPSSAVRAAAVRALGEIDDCRAVPFLIDALEASQEPESVLYSSALAALSGEELGADATRWREWWATQSCP